MTKTMDFAIDRFEPDGGALHQAIYQPLREQIVKAVGPVETRAVGVLLRDASGEPAGGAWGTAMLGWLQIEGMIVVPALRGHGLGSRLLRGLEQSAVEAGCHAAWVDTFEFQARGFYEKLGYGLFGMLQDFPLGSHRYFLCRQLAAAGGCCERAHGRQEVRAE